MSDRRRHRGPHPRDRRLFGSDRLDDLRWAAEDYAWLLGRNYAPGAALTLVGNRFQLHQRQRAALMRAVCAPEQARSRCAKRVACEGRRVVVDGFNVLVTVEAALSGGLVLRGTDRLLRDLASVHGTYRRVDETIRAIELLSGELAAASEALWLFDRPVSNSGRIAALVREAGWRAELADSADRRAIELGRPLATSDGPLIDRITSHVDLTGPIVSRLADAWVVEL
ncbi:MAG: hypothetical protein CME06_04890 [Gemmatimonadetes bacterium]|nr:hypothetical protein [Gemmatimonadota bacterium]